MPSKGLTGSEWHALKAWCVSNRDLLAAVTPDERRKLYSEYLWKLRWDKMDEKFRGERMPGLPRGVSVEELEEACRMAGVGKEAT